MSASRPLRAFFFGALALSWLCAGTALAAPRLDCVLHMNGQVQTVQARPTDDPYGVAGVDVLGGGHFRFKAVLVGDAGAVRYVKLYAYDLDGRQPVLLQQASYIAPQAQRDAAPDSLTGEQRVYSPKLERELRYGCALLEVAP